MLIDFCNKGLVKRISCSAGECDGYSVDNLISNQETQRRKGFLVDYFIKPPVTILIEFVCEISLNHIIVWPRVGAQKSTGIELSSCTDGLFNFVASGSINGDESGFIFCKNGNVAVKQKVSENFLVRSFKSAKYLQAKWLKINIFKTLSSSVPALQKIEIWGEVPSDCPAGIKDLVWNIWSKIKDCKQVKETDPVNKSYNKLQHSKPESGVDTTELNINKSYNKLQYSKPESGIDTTELKIPDEFIDAITNEIMIIPMILPSGNVIDNTTLEKFINEEAKWGRLPSDPFTGKLFTDLSKPKISLVLKGRIDKFLVNHCNEQRFKNIARTVGNSSNGPRTSCLVSKHMEDSSNTQELSVCEYPTNALKVTSDGNNVIGKQKKRKLNSETDFQCTSVKLTSREHNISCSNDIPNSRILPKPVVTSECYDKLKEQSLDSMLKSTLSNLPSFTKFSESVNNTVSCAKCTASEDLYKLPCNHYICRSCLSVMIKCNPCKCSLCFRCFGTGDPKRVHVN